MKPICHFSVLVFLLLGCTPEPQPIYPIPQPENLDKVEETRVLQAVQEAQQEVGDKPHSAEAWANLGKIYIAHDWYEAAAVCYGHAAEFDPDEFRWHFFLGRSHIHTDAATAIESFERAIAIDDNYAPAYIYGALALRKLQRFDQAKQYLRRAAKLDSKNPYAQLQLGELSLMDKQFETAHQHLQQALKLNPGQSEAHSALAQVNMALGDKTKAMEHAQAARLISTITPMEDELWAEIQLAGVSRRWFRKRGNQYLRDGKIKEAVHEFAVALEEDPIDPELWLNYGVALLRVKRVAEARTALERSLAQTRPADAPISPDTRSMTSADIAKLYVNLAVAAIGQKDLKAAEHHFKEALKINSNSFEAAFNLALLTSSQGQISQAIFYLEKAYAIRPDPKIPPLIEKIRRETRL